MLYPQHGSMPTSAVSTLPSSSDAPSHQPLLLPPASFSLLAEVFADHHFVSDLHLAFMKRDERLIQRAGKPPQRTTGPGKPRAAITKKPTIERGGQPEVPLHCLAPEGQMRDGQYWMSGFRLSALAATAPTLGSLGTFDRAQLGALGTPPRRSPLAPHDPNAAWGGEMELLAKRSCVGVQQLDARTCSAEQWLWALEAARQRNREAAARAATDFGQLTDQSPRPIAEAAA